MKNLSRDDLQERAGMWDMALVFFLLFIGCCFYIGYGDLDLEGGSLILISAAIALIASVIIAIRRLQAKKTLQRMNHDN